MDEEIKALLTVVIVFLLVYPLAYIFVHTVLFP